MKFRTLLFAFLSVMVMACSSDEPEKPDVNPDPDPTPTPTPDPDPDPDPEEIVIILSETDLEMPIGATQTISYTVTPENTPVEWMSSNERVATVDENGCVTAIARGSASITVSAGDASASCTVKVIRAAQVGDFYFSDGTYSPSLIAGKTVIGVIFWLGDPTADDAALRRDHPECTHGLVVAAYPDVNPCPWQANFMAYGKTTGVWVEQYAKEYVSPVSVWEQDTRRNVIAGYNNTKALEAFNAAAENKSWPVNVIEEVAKFRSSVPAPESSSDWFLPAVKELSLLINDVYDGDVLDFNDVAGSLCNSNRKIINETLAQIEAYGAELIGANPNWAYDYWSSTDWVYSQTYHISAQSGSIMCGSKDGKVNQLVRCVLAF